jgi:hypothetical protein
MPTCDIHDDCRDQGCTADPEHCQRARDLRAMQQGNADEAARARMAKYEANKAFAEQPRPMLREPPPSRFSIRRTFGRPDR